jgi:hypothetical protein
MINFCGKPTAVGMTTCPRSGSYIQESINSLIDNQWGVPLVYDDHEMTGDFWGFCRLVSALRNTYRTASQYLILQDDVVTTMKKEEAEEYISACGQHSLLSLFSINREPTIVSEGAYWTAGSLETEKDRIKSCCGGIAYLINRAFAHKISRHNHKSFTPTPQRIADVCRQQCVEYRVTRKNIFEHIGEVSSLHPDIPNYRWDVSAASQYRGK